MRYQLSNRNNWHPLAQFMKQLDEDFFSPLMPSNNTQAFATPQMEWHENDKGYLISFDIPGMKPEDIKIDLKENTLQVSAERKFSSEKKEGDSVRSEKFYGTYQRVIELPRDVDAENVQADYSNGVLELLIPKTEKAQAKNIQIGKGEGKLSEKFLKSEKTVDEKTASH